MTSNGPATIVPRIKSIRRVVTGHDSNGTAIFLEDGIAKQILAIGVPTHGVTDLWKTKSAPDNSDASEPCLGKLELPPPTNGTVFRIVEFPPDDELLGKVDAKTAFSTMGDDAGDTLTGHPKYIMHRTPSLDYAIVLEGEIWAVLDKDEKRLMLGDVLIQRGTNHAWSNRTTKPALVAFVMLGAQPLSLGGAGH